MKKILLLIIVSVMAFILTSCKETEKTKTDILETKDPKTEQTYPTNTDPVDKTDDTYLSGTDAAKILLAQNRLNPERLTDSVNIFNGEQVYKNLAEKIRRNKKNQKADLTGDVTITDTTVEWKNSDKNYSNSIDYFNNITGNVESSAERGAQMIRTVKSSIRVVNCWVNVGLDQYLLLVDENSETIILKSNSWVDVCRRYTNEEGLEVYELYYNGEVGQTRMKYIENTLVEYFHDNHTTEFEHHFVADNTKGYWEVYGHLNESSYSATVIKDEIVYDYIGQYGCEKTDHLDVISNDKMNDVISLVNNNAYQLAAHSFDGIDKFVVDIDSQDDIVIYQEGLTSGKVYIIDGFYYTNNPDEVKIVLDNGNVLKQGDGNDKVHYNRSTLHADHLHEIYYQYIELGVAGETLEEQFLNLKEFLTENGITCKYDLDELLNNLLLAYEEIASQSKYRLWNDVVVNSPENAFKALEIEKAKFDSFKQLIKSTETLEVIDINDQEKINSKIKFADIDSYLQDNVKFENNNVNVENLKLTINKSLLLDTRETYSLKFGLVDTKNTFNEVLLDVNLDSISYNGEDKFELTYNGEFKLVNGGIGEYALVVYLATSEGIRISNFEYVKVDDFTEYSTKDVDHVVRVSKTNDGYLLMNVEKNMDIYIANKFHYLVSYDDLMISMGSMANLYGMVPEDAYIEVKNEDLEYVKLEGDIVTGEYRLGYLYYTEEGYKNAYVYNTVLIDVVEFEHTTTSITLNEIQALFAELVTLNDGANIEVYSEMDKEFVSVNDDFEIVSGRYRVSHIVLEEENEYVAYAYLDLIVDNLTGEVTKPVE